MHAKIIDLINILVKMSGEKDNIKSLNEELLYLDNLLPELNKELETLVLSITDDKYFDASSEIIDRNIELSLKKKIIKLQEALNKQKEKIDNLSKKESEVTARYELLNKRILSSESLISVLNSHFQDENGAEEDSRYFRLLEQEKARHESLNEELKNFIDQKEQLNSQLEVLKNQKEEAIANLNSEKNQLEEVRESLADKSTYIDNQKKEEDLNKVKELELKIKNTQKRKSEIIESITYKAEQAKDLLLNSEENYTEFLSKINDITSELNTLPYQKMEDDTLLKEELCQLESRKDELTTLIENKKYTSSDIDVIEKRLEYLESKTVLISKEIEAYKEIENLIDNGEIIKTTDILVELREKARNYEAVFAEHDLNKNEQINQDLEVEKYNLLNEIITNYENDLQDLITLVNNINSKKIVDCENHLKNIKEEKEYLNKTKLLHSDSINSVEKEKDRKELKKIADNIEKLSMRLKIGITPNQVLDQIEMLLFAGEEKIEENSAVNDSPNVNKDIIKNIEMVDQNEETEINPKINDEATLQIDEPIAVNEEPSANKQLNEEIKFTFEKLPDDQTTPLNEIPEDMIINPIAQNAEIFSAPKDEEHQDYSFSPLDNTGFISFDDALNIAKNEDK